MKNPDQKEQEKRLLSEIEHVLLATGQKIPVTVEQVEIYLKNNPPESLPQPEEDFETFYQRVCINKNYGKGESQSTFKPATASLAARQGAEPSSETLKKMEADREAAMKRLRK